MDSLGVWFSRDLARAAIRLSPDLFAALARTSDAVTRWVRLVNFNCKKDWDLREDLNMSRASSLWRIAIALLMASISPARSSCLSFHSAFLVAKSFAVCSMKPLSLEI